MLGRRVWTLLSSDVTVMAIVPLQISRSVRALCRGAIALGAGAVRSSRRARVRSAVRSRSGACVVQFP
jgi:hypothetical protein